MPQPGLPAKAGEASGENSIGIENIASITPSCLPLLELAKGSTIQASLSVRLKDGRLAYTKEMLKTDIGLNVLSKIEDQISKVRFADVLALNPANTAAEGISLSTSKDSKDKAREVLLLMINSLNSNSLVLNFILEKLKIPYVVNAINRDNNLIIGNNPKSMN